VVFTQTWRLIVRRPLQARQLVANDESQRFMVVAYVEGWDCERMDDLGNCHQYNLKISALKASGLLGGGD